MALYDNKFWLLSHIRNSFISTDDTGMCELVMAGETKDIKQHISRLETYPEPEDSEDDEDEFESFDFQIELDFGIRERSNTSVQLEKLDLARKKASKMRHIKWESTGKSPSNVDDMFVKKDISQIMKTDNITSMLSTMMKNYSNVPKNPFIEFAKFDGSGQVNIPTKKYKIYLTMLPQQQKNYPMPICCVATAKVEELIGLILLKFSTIQDATTLKPVTQYGLYITEEDGEVDRDFPCLDAKEPISKFGFACLGLVEHKENFRSVSFPDDTRPLFSIESTRRTRTLSDKAKADETRQMENDMQAVEEHNKLMEAPLYRSFRAYLLSKVKPKVEVNIGVSGERIEIDPVPQKVSKLVPFKQKAVSHGIDAIVWCEIMDIKNVRTTFRLVYSLTGVNRNTTVGPKDLRSSSSASSYPPALPTSSSFKHYDFESDKTTAQDIVQKIRLILELKSSATRGGYIAAKEKKMYKRKSINLIK